MLRFFRCGSAEKRGEKAAMLPPYSMASMTAVIFSNDRNAASFMRLTTPTQVFWYAPEQILWNFRPGSGRKSPAGGFPSSFQRAAPLLSVRHCSQPILWTGNRCCSGCPSKSRSRPGRAAGSLLLRRRRKDCLLPQMMDCRMTDRRSEAGAEAVFL